MQTKEKALELVKKMLLDDDVPFDIAIECALIAVNEIIEQWEYIDTHIADDGGKLNPNLKYWLEVKQEIEKL